LTTEHFYKVNANKFFNDTALVDMSALYIVFSEYLKKGDRVLDAGCGSGRDSKYFKEKGYDVEAFDVCEELTLLATDFSGITVDVKRFEELDVDSYYDGIWCCASLLHVPYARMVDVFTRLRNACKDRGIIYMSFKYGQNERVQGGRHFTDLDEFRLMKIVENTSGLIIRKVWNTSDQREDRKELWINTILEVSR